jgi:hypothetical protein
MNPYVIGGVALVIAIMGWQLKSSVTRNGELSAKLETQAMETLECTDANSSNVKTITEIREQLVVMVNERRIDAELRETVMDERDQAIARARVAADELQEERDDEINSNPDCADLASLSVGFFCPDTGSQLRQRSSGQGGDQDGND